MQMACCRGPLRTQPSRSTRRRWVFFLVLQRRAPVSAEPRNQVSEMVRLDGELEIYPENELELEVIELIEADAAEYSPKTQLQCQNAALRQARCGLNISIEICTFKMIIFKKIRK
jgi:hypothetical protein